MRMRKQWMIAVVAAGICLTGCIPRPTGGEKTEAALSMLAEGEYEPAQELLLQALEEGEDAVPAWRALGIACLSLAQNAEAENAFEEALSYTDEKMPDTTRDIRLYLLTAQYRGGEYEKAIATAEELRTQKDTAEISFYLGASNLALGNSDEARAAFDAAVGMAPSDYLLYLQIYGCYEQRNQTAIGDEYLQTALSIPPKSREDEYHVGQIYYYLGMYDQARLAIAEGVDEQYLPAMELLGEIYLAENDYNRAMDMYQTMLDTKGEEPLIYNGLAMCAMQAKDYQRALSYIGQGLALSEEEGRSELLFNEIVCYERMLDFDTAKVKAESYHQQYPTDQAGAKELQFLSTR